MSTSGRVLIGPQKGLRGEEAPGTFSGATRGLSTTACLSLRTTKDAAGQRNKKPRDSLQQTRAAENALLARHALKLQHQAQRHSHIDRIDGADRRGIELFLDMLPRRLCPMIFWQMLHQLAHVGEGDELRHFGDDKRPGQRP